MLSLTKFDEVISFQTCSMEYMKYSQKRKFNKREPSMSCNYIRHADIPKCVH